MQCQGSGKPPRTLYKAVKHYPLRNGRMNYHSGQGECSHCGAAHAVKPRANGEAYVTHHKDIRTCTPETQKQNKRRKQFWFTRHNMNQFTQTNDWTPVNYWGGTVAQTISVVETPAWTNTTTNYGGQSWWSPSRQQFRVELSSSTPAPHHHGFIFQFNDQTIVAPQERITLAIDYVSWNAWNNSITVSNNARIYGNQTWNNWITRGTVGDYNNVPVYDQAQMRRAQRQQNIYTAPREDPIAREERRQREAEALFQRVQAENRAREEAKENAHQLLLSLLTPEQREEYQERKQFHIRGSKGTLFRILHGSSGNVRQVLSEADAGRGMHGFCAHPRMAVDRYTADEAGIVAGHLPHEDAMIAQVLALMTDEDQFLAIANRHW